ncbi:hypothetical protein BGZ76_003627, partial [Entomortierella beljakovae]
LVSGRQKRSKNLLIPDQIFVDSIENLSFPMSTIVKHKNKIHTQLKAAVNFVQKKNAIPTKPRRKKSEVQVSQDASGRSVSPQVARRVKGDVVTVSMNGMEFH